MTLRLEDLLGGKSIFFVGAHPDDNDLGMGGTMWKLRKESVEYTCFSSAVNIAGNHSIEDEFWSTVDHYGIGLRTTLYQDIPTMKFFQFEDLIKDRLFYTREHFKPDIIFAPSTKSHNMDHSVVGRAVLNVFQEQSVLFYEDIRGGQEHESQVYIKLGSDDLINKLQACEKYHSQKERKYFLPDKITSLAQMRGAQIGEKYAESFSIGRLVL